MGQEEKTRTDRGEKLVEEAFGAHHTETDVHYKRVLELVAAWHFVTIPLGPLLALMQVLAGEGERVQALWLVVAPVCTLFTIS